MYIMGNRKKRQLKKKQQKKSNMKKSKKIKKQSTHFLNFSNTFSDSIILNEILTIFYFIKEIYKIYMVIL